MIDQVAIQNFRGIRHVELDNVQRICLVSGKNNVGKSTLLEAIFLLMDHTANESFSKVNGFRGAFLGDSTAMWDSFFYGLDSTEKIVLSVVEGANRSTLTYRKDTAYVPVSDGIVSDDVLAQFRAATRSSYSLGFSYVENGYEESGHFSISSGSMLRQMNTSLPGGEIKAMRPTRFLTASISRSLEPVADGIGRLELSGEKPMIVSVLQKMDPAIEDIVTVSVQGISQLHVRARGQWIPIQLSGDGVMRLLQICLAILEHRDGLVLVDEIESGLHYSTYGALWRAVEEMSRRTGTQVIATTHSYEMIAAARESIEDADCFSYFRLGKTAEDVRAHRFSLTMLGDALDSEMEVR